MSAREHFARRGPVSSARLKTVTTSHRLGTQCLCEVLLESSGNLEKVCTSVRKLTQRPQTQGPSLEGRGEECKLCTALGCSHTCSHLSPPEVPSGSWTVVAQFEHSLLISWERSFPWAEWEADLVSKCELWSLTLL